MVSGANPRWRSSCSEASSSPTPTTSSAILLGHMRSKAVLFGFSIVIAVVVASSTPLVNRFAFAFAEDQHAYYNALKARSDFWKGVSLRPAPGVTCTSGGYSNGRVVDGTCNPDFETQLTGRADVTGLRNGSTPSTPESRFITYDFAGDTDRNKQDAAKLVIPAFGTRGTLAAPISATDRTLTIESSTIPNIGTNQAYRVDNEIMVCDNTVDMNPAASGNQCFVKNSTTYSIHVQRGQFGTVAASHGTGSAFKSTINGLDPAAQLRYPLITSDNNSYVFTFDIFFTDSWIGVGLANDTGAKFFQFASAETFWLETIFPYRGGDSSSGKCAGYDATGGASKNVAGVWMHVYNNSYAGATSWSASGGDRVGPNVTGVSELQPMGPAAAPNSGFCIKPNTWTRIWYRIRQVANDYDIFDMWVADETRDPVQLFNGLQLSVPTDGARPNEISRWWVEGNNTYTQHTLGDVNPFRDRVIYLRNFAALRNGDVAGLLQRPVAGLLPRTPPLEPPARLWIIK